MELIEYVLDGLKEEQLERCLLEAVLEPYTCCRNVQT